MAIGSLSPEAVHVRSCIALTPWHAISAATPKGILLYLLMEATMPVIP
jgi:hypothetical protein